MAHGRLRISIVAAALVVAQAVAAAVPDALSYQGVLKNAGGQPLSGPVSLRFRIFRGGDATTTPSTGVLVYHERATVTASAGVFSHLIGTGVPATDCTGGACVLGADVFGPGNLPVWIEVTLDPDGTVGSADDDLLLPRTRVGTVGYAYRVGTLEGATGGALTGTLVADQLVGRTGAVLGDDAASTVDLRFETADGATTLTWDPQPGELRFADSARYTHGLTIDPTRSIGFGPLRPIANSPYLRFNHSVALQEDGDFDGQPDAAHTLSLCYNCQPGSFATELATEYAMHARWDMTASTGPGQRWVYHAWNFLAPGQTAFQPFLFQLDTNFAGGYFNPTANWAFRTSRTRTALAIHSNGNVLVGSEAFPPAFPLDVVGSIHASDHLELDRGRELRFGSVRALTTNSTGSWLQLGGGFPEVRVPVDARFEQGLTMADTGAVNWGPYSNPVAGTYIRQITTGSLFADGNLDGVPDFDHVWGLCYNCREDAAVPDVAGEYQMISQWEMTYAPADGQRWIEHNWDFRDPSSNLFRPLGVVIDTDRAGGYANPTARWTFSTAKNRIAMNIHSNGNVRIGPDAAPPAYPLDVSGTVRATGDLRLGTGGSLYLDDKRALNTDASGALVLGDGQDVVAIGTASFVLSSCPDVTSATDITVDPCSVVRLTGSSSVRSIQTCDTARKGRVLHVLCAAAGPQLCDSCASGNLRLAANLSCSTDDTITLLCDGTVWRELSRAVN